VKAITEELCGHRFSASSISAMNQRLDTSLAQFAARPLAEAFPYLILDARYERVREAGVITSQAVLIAIGIDWDGRRQVLAVALANRESRSSWRDFLLGLKTRGLHGVEFVVADDHAGLRAALREVLAEAPISAAMCIFCGTRSTTCRARWTTTACKSCAGCTTGAISPRRAAIWQPGSPSGLANTQS
jgi:transposase-like protein